MSVLSLLGAIAAQSAEPPPPAPSPPPRATDASPASALPILLPFETGQVTITLDARGGTTHCAATVHGQAFESVADQVCGPPTNSPLPRGVASDATVRLAIVVGITREGDAPVPLNAAGRRVSDVEVGVDVREDGKVVACRVLSQSIEIPEIAPYGNEPDSLCSDMMRDRQGFMAAGSARRGRVRITHMVEGMLPVRSGER